MVARRNGEIDVIVPDEGHEARLQAALALVESALRHEQEEIQPIEMRAFPNDSVVLAIAITITRRWPGNPGF